MTAPRQKPKVDEAAALKKEAYGDKGSKLRKAAVATNTALSDTVKTAKPKADRAKGPIDRVTGWIGRQAKRIAGKKKS